MIDINVISGFLGSGKTTYANLLLKYYLAKGERAVYIVNEFGETQMDANLIRKDGFEAVALSNGCICCTLKGDLILSLREIVKTFAPAKIVFETSGIFVFNQFYDIIKDEYLRRRCRFGRTVTVVDSINFDKENIAAGSFIENQIKNADILILSKLERFSGNLENITSHIASINPKASVVARVWNEPGFVEKVFSAKGGRICSSEHLHAHMESMSVEISDLSRDEYSRFIANLISGEFGQLLRVKGYINVEGETHQLHVAQNDIILRKEKDRELPTLTLIGHNINRKIVGKLKDTLNA